MGKPQLQSGYVDASDAALAGMVTRGNQAAFEVVMRRYNRTLFRTARAILRDDAEAEDAVQEAYLKAYRTIENYRGDASLSTWLARIVANEALQRRRTQVRRSSIVPLFAGAEEEDIDRMAESRMDTEPETMARRGEMRSLLEDSIDALPQMYRAVFMLRAVEEYSVEEIASILQIPEATVRSRFFRARSLIRENLAAAADMAYRDAFDFAGERCDGMVERVMARIGARTTG
ncbi:MAG: RNA polymerase sigma factor [Burkholderiaceae bacterium]|nr:RNA polymerase sigma factor [Burkholderiaceae bacterium]